METFDWHTWVILPLLVFFARAFDVALGTLRIIFTSRGKRHLAPLLGFVEVFIWISIIAQITRGASNVAAYFAYAAGFAAGNYLGMYIENKLAIGTLVIRAIVPEEIASPLAKTLQEKGLGMTSVSGMGSHGPVKLIYTIVMRKELTMAAEVIKSVHPNAFFTVEELRSAEHGIFLPSAQTSTPFGMLAKRKSK
ncbi:MAG: DUF5698 domain-containing protein [Anaerolineales bacterium]|jgi:uncharacterized protein YebE (UPF0316 family)|nr:DUF2179 domain-containing protein [Anaerolineales bacterium]WKZ40990.1 MAG: DUF5698 domain-containing protein [Anaerolineales bacterium]